MTRFLSTLLLLAIAPFASAATLSDPEVDKYNVRIGTQTFAGLYQFTTNTLLVETAQAIQAMGSDTIKLYLGIDYPRRGIVEFSGADPFLHESARIFISPVRFSNRR